MQTGLFGARLSELRENMGLTLRQLAAALEIDHTYLSHLESGRRTPSDELLGKIATHFGQEVDVLRLLAGQVPERLLTAMQRNPQLTLALLGNLKTPDQQTNRQWYANIADLIAKHTPGQLHLGVLDAHPQKAFARHIDAGKNTPIYNAHSYHTKVPYQGIIPYIEHYTKPGDLVLDPFCGSGMAGVAAVLCGRDAILNDLSPAAVHIARNYVTPCPYESLENAFASIKKELLRYEVSLYETTCDTCGGDAIIEYSVMTDVFACPSCGSELTVWEHGRDIDGKLLGHLECPSCHGRHDKNDLRWNRYEPCLVSYTCVGACAGTRSQRSPTGHDLERLATIARSAIPGWIPEKEFGSEWEMWRQGHADRGITSVSDFFTGRNLRALAAIHERIQSWPEPRTAAALLFAFTGCVNRASKRYQWNLKRPTNVLSGTLYVSSLFYEFNVFRLFERKVRAAMRLFRTTLSAKGTAAVGCGSATQLKDVPDNSVDYVFSDPPFGSNIYYADCSLLWEAWLGDYTDRSREIVINRSLTSAEGGKTLLEYAELLTDALREIRRVLKPDRWASIVFHNSSAAVWDAVRTACVDAGFTLSSAVMFDKGQRSFKGLKGLHDGEKVANYDVVLNLQKRPPILVDAETQVASETRIVEIIRDFLSIAAGDGLYRRSTAYLHSIAVQSALNENLDLAQVDMRRFEELLRREFQQTGVGWYIKTDLDLPFPSDAHFTHY